MIDEYLQYIQEGYIFSDKTISIDLHKFENGECDKLFIIGIAGSGKTSTGKILSKKYGKECCSLDHCYQKFYDKNIVKNSKNSKEVKQMKKKLHECFIDIIKDKQCKIVEGVNLMNICKKDSNINSFVMKQSCIIMGRSALLGSLKGAIRNSKHGYENIIMGLIHLGYENFTNFQKSLIEFRKERSKQPNTIVKEYK
jgi:hypothetical protein